MYSYGAKVLVGIVYEGLDGENHVDGVKVVEKVPPLLVTSVISVTTAPLEVLY